MPFRVLKNTTPMTLITSPNFCRQVFLHDLCTSGLGSAPRMAWTLLPYPPAPVRRARASDSESPPRPAAANGRLALAVWGRAQLMAAPTRAHSHAELPEKGVYHAHRGTHCVQPVGFRRLGRPIFGFLFFYFRTFSYIWKVKQILKMNNFRKCTNFEFI
jgi:hypothetical protein